MTVADSSLHSKEVDGTDRQWCLFWLMTGDVIKVTGEHFATNSQNPTSN